MKIFSVFRTRPAAGLAAAFLLFAPALYAADRTEWVDQDKDGRKETKVYYEGQKIVKSESDRDGDGKIDTWTTYNETGHAWKRAADTNKDGKRDQFKEFINGDREFVIQENDLNFDGKLDRRKFSKWNPNKSLQVFNGSRMMRIPNPGYVTLWKEEDTDFDGIIDKYYEKGKPRASARIGKPIATRPVLPVESKPAQASRSPKSLNEEKIKRLNEKHGIA